MVMTSKIICTLLRIGCAQLEIIDRWNILFVLAIPRVLDNIFISSSSQVASRGVSSVWMAEPNIVLLLYLFEQALQLILKFGLV